MIVLRLWRHGRFGAMPAGRTEKRWCPAHIDAALPDTGRSAVGSRSRCDRQVGFGAVPSPGCSDRKRDACGVIAGSQPSSRDAVLSDDLGGEADLARSSLVIAVAVPELLREPGWNRDLNGFLAGRGSGRSWVRRRAPHRGARSSDVSAARRSSACRRTRGTAARPSGSACGGVAALPEDDDGTRPRARHRRTAPSRASWRGA